MNILLISTLVGVTWIFQGAKFQDTARATLSVWPPGSSIYLGESVCLRCSVPWSIRWVWTYRWFKHSPHAALTSNPRHLIYGDSYSIIAVGRADGGSYWCQAEGKAANSTTLLLSDPANLTVSELLSPPLLSVNISSRQHFRGGHLSVQCPLSKSPSTAWRLRQFSEDVGARTTDFRNGSCTPLEGDLSEGSPNTCIFSSLYSGNGGLYWCESEERRSNAVNITVSYGTMIIQSPAHSVSEGDTVVFKCHYWSHIPNQTIFCKDGVEVVTQNATEMTIANVTAADEGFYHCLDRDRKRQSPESWLSVKRNQTLRKSVLDHKELLSTDGAGKWIGVSCCIAGTVFLVSLTFWLLHHYRLHMWFTRSCCSLSKGGPSPGDLPQTKQDVTEIQWDLAWMEMSNLIDKPYPAS